MERIRGNGHITGRDDIEISRSREIITRRRLQILVHSCLYYKFDEPLVTDKTYDNWCKDLVRLQVEYPKVSKHCPYHRYFNNFDGSTGFNLPYTNPEIMAKAEHLLKIKKVKRKKHCKIKK